MAITLKHDAFGVVPPSNAATRKYGQSLVLQQQQQKYSGQQAGYDRLFRAGSQLQQQNWQGTRDKQINDFQAARDKQQFDWKQQEAETARQAGFLDDARKMSTGIIMDDIKNGAYDTATASQLRQNLIDEAEALGNPNLDATQRAEILAKIRAKRATLTANRIEAPPKPTPDEELRGSIRTLNGIDFKKDKDGIWQPVDYGKGQQGQQQPPQPQRPTSVDDAIRADSKRYDAILDYEITALTGEDKPLTPELLDQARERARKQYEKELGLGTPTLAPELPDSGSKPTGFGTSSAAYYNAPDSEAKQDPLGGAAPMPDTAKQGPLPPAETGPSELEWRAQMREHQRGLPNRDGAALPAADDPFNGKNAWTPEQLQSEIAAIDQQMQAILREDGGVNTNNDARLEELQRERDRLSAIPQGNQDGAAQEPAQASNQWVEAEAVAAGAEQPAAPTASQGNASGSPTVAPQPSNQAPATPNFKSLTEGAANDAERAVVSQIETLYQGQSPDVQAAISVLLNPGSLEQELIEAYSYLQGKGIDMNAMGADAEKNSKPGSRAKGKMRDKYGSSYDSF